MLLLALAVGATAYPIWWNHRSTRVGNLLIQRARSHGGLASGRGGAPEGCGPGTEPVAIRADPGVLQIPALDLTAPVLQGLGNPVLNVAVGRDPATVWPGARGESLLLAHDVSYFSGLDRLRVGDRLVWRLGCERAVFRVIATAVSAPGAVVPVPASGAGLALVTCWPTDTLFWTPERFIVEAERTARETVAHTVRAPMPRPTDLVVPAPSALAALGLSPAQDGMQVGHLEVVGSPSAAFRQGPEPLAVAAAALRDDAAADKAAIAHNAGWWSKLALAGVPMPSPWPLVYVTNITLVAHGTVVVAVVLSSPVRTVTLAVRHGVLFVKAMAGGA